MEGTYSVMHGEQVVGKAFLYRQGMFYCIRCQCMLSGEVLFRLIMSVDAAQIDLGILAKEKDCFGLQTRVNVKTIGQGTVSFSIRPRKDSHFYPMVRISPEEPFVYLSRLENMYLLHQNGKMMLKCKDEK